MRVGHRCDQMEQGKIFHQSVSLVNVSLLKNQLVELLSATTLQKPTKLLLACNRTTDL